MERREFVGWAAALGVAVLMGAIGGMTAEEDGVWGDETPPP